MQEDRQLRKDPGFAPADPLDGRTLGEWQTRYQDPRARRGIACEAIYLMATFFGFALLLFMIWSDYFKGSFSLTDAKYEDLAKGFYAWGGGALGGSMFSMKWLIHAVARNTWNEDRRLWRLMTPHISGGLGFVVIVMMQSGLLMVFDATAIRKSGVVFSLGFLVGYFSDSALAKLAEIAKSLFGKTAE